MSHGGPFSHTKFRFNLPGYEDSKNRRREMVRFGYRKVSVVAPWKVEERGQVRGKEAGSVGRSLQEAVQKMMTWMKARLPRMQRKRHPNIIFLQASLKSFSGMQNI